MATRQMLIGTVFQDFFSQTTSIEFNGVDESMENSTEVDIGIANTWSLMMWMRRRGDAVGLNNANHVLRLVNAGGTNLISVQSRGDFANDPIRILTRAPSTSTIKDFRFNVSLFPFDTWNQLILTWDGTTLTTYNNGSVVVPSTKTSDFSGTMTATDRSVLIGNVIGGSQPLSGFIHSIALWDADITSAVTEIYNSGVASTFNLSKASFSGNLQHWWRLGQVSTDLGKDSGIGSPLIDVDVDSTNITSDDIDSESPS